MNKQHHRIVILGIGRSGTTGLFSRIKKSLPSNTISFFEPVNDQGKLTSAVQSGHPVLVKILIGQAREFLDSLNSLFNKRILLIREPRDIWISALLYSSAIGLSDLWQGPVNRILGCVSLLEQKEQKPGSISSLDLYKTLNGEQWFDQFIQRAIHQINLLVRLYESGDFFVFKYENITAGEFRALENYLNLSISGDDTVEAEYQRVVRTKASGAWKDWLLPDDILFLKPLLTDAIDALGYDPAWELNPVQKILPQHCSEYFRKIINEKRISNGLNPL